MLTVRYRSWVDRPPHRVTCRLDAPLGSDGTRPELTGLYRDGMWVFELPGEGWTTCRLVLDGQVEGVFPTGVRDTAAAVSADHERAARGFTDDDVIFATPPIAVDDGRLQQTWFAEGPEKDQLWDVVVVGTGMGGGVLLSALADKVVEGAQPTMAVLGLEAGSLLFPTHVANLPRVYFGGPTAFSTSLWSTIETFGSQPFATDPGPVDPPVAEADRWTGHEVFALGGRTLYWGGLCPRISEGELDRWPPPVTRDLVDSTAPGQPGGYYDRAEVLLGVGSPDADPLQSRTEQMLDGLGTGRINEPAPVALRHEKRTSWRIPGGLFSTAELLLEGRLSQAAPNGSFGVPYLHLGELVVGVEPIADADGGRWLVRGVDLRDNSPTRHRARAVVLSAGTVESARIIEASPVQLPGAGVGVGLTEHTMVFKHFQIPPSTVPDGSTGSAQVLSTPPSRDSPDQWNLLLELGSDLALGRSYPLPWSDTKVTDGWIAGQLVFFGRADLDGGSVHFTADSWPALNSPAGTGLHAAVLHPAFGGVPQEWQELADRILDELGARPLPWETESADGRDWRTLVPGGRGFVSHEVGTLRMGESGGIVDSDLQVRLQGTREGRADQAPAGLYVCDNSVFPTSPAANPSLTLAALALRLADHLWDTLDRS